MPGCGYLTLLVRPIVFIHCRNPNPAFGLGTCQLNEIQT